MSLLAIKCFNFKCAMNQETQLDICFYVDYK